MLYNDSSLFAGYASQYPMPELEILRRFIPFRWLYVPPFPVSNLKYHQRFIPFRGTTPHVPSLNLKYYHASIPFRGTSPYFQSLNLKHYHTIRPFFRSNSIQIPSLTASSQASSAQCLLDGCSSTVPWHQQQVYHWPCMALFHRSWASQSTSRMSDDKGMVCTPSRRHYHRCLDGESYCWRRRHSKLHHQ